MACLSIVSFSWTCQIVLATRRYPNPVQLVSNKTVKEYEVQSNLSKLSKGEGRRAFYLEHQATNNLTSLCKVCGIGEISTPNCTKSGSKCSPGWCDANSNCTACPPGSYNPQVNATQCLPCPAGQYQQHAGQPNCSFCPPGSYQSFTGQSSCIPCGGGYYNPCSGSTSRNSCRECSPGYYCPSQSKVPIQCPAGYFCPDIGLQEAIPCPSGSYCPRPGMTTTFVCPEGFYCANLATVQPVVCPRDYYCPTGTSNPLRCSVLFTSEEQQTSCSPTVAFYVVIILAAILTVALLSLVSWRIIRTILRKRSQHRPAQSQSFQSRFPSLSSEQLHTERTKLIPEPIDGPCYSGL